MNLLRVVAGQQRAARGPAARGVVELSEAQPVAGKGIEVWGGDFAAVTAGVGETHVVGEDEDNVGLCRRGGGVQQRGRREQGQQSTGDAEIKGEPAHVHGVDFTALDPETSATMTVTLAVKGLTGCGGAYGETQAAMASATVFLPIGWCPSKGP